MVKLVSAVYENGVFRPLEAVEGIPDKSAVRLRVEAPSPAGGTLDEFSGRWTAEEADEVGAIIEREFGRVDPSEW